ncbi:MAG: hypothetical protein RL266_1366 [Bacteroidota bacterium]|jgi:gliding motility-associated-like protein
MNNSFDDKIRQSLENFEMPYDASAWAALEKQLPSSPTPVPSGSSTFGLKLVAGIALVATTAVCIWYFNSDDSKNMAIENKIESTDDHVQEDTDLNGDSQSHEPSQQLQGTGLEKTLPVQAVKSTDEVRTQTEPVDVSTAQNATETIVSEPESKSETSKLVSNPIGQSIVPVRAPLSVKFMLSDAAVCVGEEVTFLNESSRSADEFIWEFGDGTTSSEQITSHGYELPGVYTVTLTGFDKQQLKSAQHTMTVKVNPVPTPILSGEPILNGFEAIPLYRFTTATQPSETAVWSFSDGTVISGNSAEHLFREERRSVATLTVTNSFGCISTMQNEYETKEFNLLAPSVFSPNGDGLNETFIPVALPEMGIGFELKIQDPRTGETVYRTENAAAPWDGTLNNAGHKLDEGIYVWTVVLKKNVVKNRVFNGTIHLQR